MSQYVGLIAGFCTTVCYVPQLMRVFKMKSAREISISYTLLILAGTLLWLTYGIMTSSLPLILWNIIVFVLVCVLLYAKLKYGKSPEADKKATEQTK